MSEESEQYGIFLAQYKLVWDTKLEMSKLLDKAILTLAGGSFGLSVTFIRQVVPDIVPETVIYLKMAWGSFTGSLLLVIVSLFATQFALNRQFVLLEKQYIHYEDIEKLKNTPSHITRYLSLLAGLAFIVGAVFLAIFSTKNL